MQNLRLLSISRRSQLSGVLADAPAVRRDVLLGDGRRFVFERRRHRVVEAVHESEKGDERGDLDDRTFGPVALHLLKELVGDFVRLRAGGNREIERDAFRFREERTRLVFPDFGELLLVDASPEGPLFDAVNCGCDAMLR